MQLLGHKQEEREHQDYGGKFFFPAPWSEIFVLQDKRIAGLYHQLARFHHDEKTRDNQYGQDEKRQHHCTHPGAVRAQLLEPFNL